MVVITGRQFCDAAGENSWSMGYVIWDMQYGGVAVWGIQIVIHTAHVWKYKAQCEHNYYTSNYHHM